MTPSTAPRQVFDWDGRPVGWVREAVRNPRTGSVRSLLVNLGPEARAALGIPDVTLAIPARQVVTLRRDSVGLGVRIPELAHSPAAGGAVAAVPR